MEEGLPSQTRQSNLNATQNFMNPLFHCFSGAMLLFLTLIASPARAANINWGVGAQDITGDSDVSTNGSLIGAFNFSDTGPSATVNGVTFQSFAVPNNTTNSATMGNFTINSAGNFQSRNTNASSGNAPFSNLSAGYQALLSGFTTGDNPWTLTASGLTIGMQYNFQWWINFSSENATQHTTATAGNSVTLAWNPSDTDGGLGQFALGTFTADSTTEVITFDSPDFFGIVSGFQLRQIGPASVPESGTRWRSWRSASLGYCLPGVSCGWQTSSRHRSVEQGTGTLKLLISA